MVVLKNGCHHLYITVFRNTVSGSKICFIDSISLCFFITYIIVCVFLTALSYCMNCEMD